MDVFPQSSRCKDAGVRRKSDGRRDDQICESAESWRQILAKHKEGARARDKPCAFSPVRALFHWVPPPVAPDNAIAYRSTRREVVDFSGAGRDDDVRLIHPDSALRSTPSLSFIHTSPHNFRTPYTLLSNLYNYTPLQSRSLSDYKLSHFQPGLRGPLLTT